MNDRAITTRRLFFYLSDETKLAFRFTCKKVLASLRNDPGICSTQTLFLIRVSGFYADRGAFMQAWIYYNKIIISGNPYPAVLHKLRDPKAIQGKAKEATKYKLAREFIMGIDGRLYYPGSDNGRHNWSLNYAWTMANIDLKRSFVILSDMTDLHLYRQGSTRPSAFAKEIGMVVKANYSITINDDDQFVLIPPAKQENAYLVLANNETISLFSNAKNMGDDLLVANAIKQLFSSIKEYLDMLTCEITTLQHLKEAFSEETLAMFVDDSIEIFHAFLKQSPHLLPRALQGLRQIELMKSCPEGEFENVINQPNDASRLKQVDILLSKTLTPILISCFNRRLEQLSHDNADDAPTAFGNAGLFTKAHQHSSDPVDLVSEADLIGDDAEASTDSLGDADLNSFSKPTTGDSADPSSTCDLAEELQRMSM